MSEHLKFALIACCFLTAISGRESSVNEKDYRLLVVAMAFTLVSDFFLVELNIQEIGVTTFCVVQLTYFVRHTGTVKWLKYCPAVLIPAAIAYVLQGSYLIFIFAVYAQCLFLSVSSAVVAFRRKRFHMPNNLLILLGMVLFLLCDICVGLHNMGVLGIESPISAAAYRLIWVFYAPSQVLLALSSRKWGKENESVKN